jgi:hypothetical protein
MDKTAQDWNWLESEAPSSWPSLLWAAYWNSGVSKDACRVAWIKMNQSVNERHQGIWMRRARGGWIRPDRYAGPYRWIQVHTDGYRYIQVHTGEELVRTFLLVRAYW